MKKVFASSVISHVSAAAADGSLGIALFHSGASELAGLGHELPDAILKLPKAPSVRAWDFLALALAVFGVDRFVMRRGTPDGWTRQIQLTVEMVEPECWSAKATSIADLLRFLTGDIWSLKFAAGGKPPPNFNATFTDRTCACLFSGGLDSLIGAADLVAKKHNPLLVSQASPKEGGPQRYLAGQLGLSEHRFEGKVIERGLSPYEASSRARSVLFIAYGVLAATSLVARDHYASELIIPENGLISINPPLTRRRIGSLSARTTHPHFLSSLQRLLHNVGLRVNLINPYKHNTKGEMLVNCQNDLVRRIAKYSYSCGKGKRLNQHCGRCVPCLIRRASFTRAGQVDATDYRTKSLAMSSANDDVFAARTALAQLDRRSLSMWIAEAGPLPWDLDERKGYVDVVRRGLAEIKTFFDGVAWG